LRIGGLATRRSKDRRSKDLKKTKKKKMPKKRKLIIVNNTNEEFTPSSCLCSFCQEMNQSLLDWEKFEASTVLQERMKEVISRIEENASSSTSPRMMKRSRKRSRKNSKKSK